MAERAEEPATAFITEQLIALFRHPGLRTVRMPHRLLTVTRSPTLLAGANLAVARVARRQQRRGMLTNCATVHFTT